MNEDKGNELAITALAWFLGVLICCAIALMVAATLAGLIEIYRAVR